jgi:hypothetical protein
MVDFLVTLDRKHVLGRPELVAFANKQPRRDDRMWLAARAGWSVQSFDMQGSTYGFSGDMTMIGMLRP